MTTMETIGSLDSAASSALLSWQAFVHDITKPKAVKPQPFYRFSLKAVTYVLKLYLYT